MEDGQRVLDCILTYHIIKSCLRENNLHHPPPLSILTHVSRPNYPTLLSSIRKIYIMLSVLEAINPEYL